MSRGPQWHDREPEVEQHNSGQWLLVEFWDGAKSFRDPRGWLQHRESVSGWYVLRTCPCHAGQRVSERYDSEERAEAARRMLIEVAMRLGT